MDKYVKTADVQRILDIERGCLQEWLTGNYVPCDVANYGKRRFRVFTRKHLHHIGIFKTLRDIGLCREKCAELAHSIMMDYGNMNFDQYCFRSEDKCVTVIIEVSEIMKNTSRLINEQTD